MLPEDAGGLDSVVHLAQIMLIANLWIDVGLVNGAVGTIISICYECGGPPDLPLSVMIKFDKYTGPTLPDGSVPITPIHWTWSNSGTQCSHLQLPLKLAWAVTIHKAQGVKLDKVVIDVGNNEFLSGLTYVACFCVRYQKDLLFTSPFPYGRLSNLSKSQRLQDRLKEDNRLQSMHLSSSLSPSLLHSLVDPITPHTPDQSFITINTSDKSRCSHFITTK